MVQFTLPSSYKKGAKLLLHSCCAPCSTACLEVLKDYFALLFPTRFYTEGIPGTILDAYAAGLPIISAKWLNFNDILDDTVCLSYDFEDTDKLKEILLDENLKDKLNALKVNCLTKAQDYTPKKIVSEFLERIK